MFFSLILFTLQTQSGLTGSHTVYLSSPANSSYTNLDNDSLQFIYNHTGFLGGSVTCRLYLDNSERGYELNVSANLTTVVYANTTYTQGLHT